MSYFRLLGPNRVRGDVFSDPLDLRLEVVSGKTLQRYLQENNLIARRLQCRVLLEPHRTPVRMTYVPKAGETIRMVRTSPMS